MKLVITAQGPNPDDPVDPRFGRAAYHILFDDKAGTFTTLDNAGREAAQGAGVQAAQAIAASGAEALLTGHCGPKAFQALNAAGVSIFSGVEGRVLDAVQAWRDGRLAELKSPDGTPRH